MDIKRLQAVFFDFDGVIVDSTRIKTEAFRTLFQDFADGVIEKIVRYHTHHGGISRVEKIDYAHRTIIKKPLSTEDLRQWAAAYSALVIEKVIKADWIAGARECLEHLSATIPVFVISGTPEDELREVIRRRDMARYFDEVLGSPIKKPEHIRYLLGKYILAPHRCVFVGDALTDYEAAKETGLHFIGIRKEVSFPIGTTVLPDCVDLLPAMAAGMPPATAAS